MQESLFKENDENLYNRCQLLIAWLWPENWSSIESICKENFWQPLSRKKCVFFSPQVFSEKLSNNIARIYLIEWNDARCLLLQFKLIRWSWNEELDEGVRLNRLFPYEQQRGNAKICKNYGRVATRCDWKGAFESLTILIFPNTVMNKNLNANVNLVSSNSWSLPISRSINGKNYLVLIFAKFKIHVYHFLLVMLYTLTEIILIWIALRSKIVVDTANFYYLFASYCQYSFLFEFIFKLIFHTFDLCTLL